MTRVHRVNVNFSEGAWNDLQTLAARRGKSISEVIRDAIAFERWWLDQEAAGCRIMVERDGNVREVVLR